GVIVLALMILIARGVTRRTQAQQRFESALEAAPSGMLIVGNNGAILFANSEAERMFLHPRQNLMRMRVEDLIPSPPRDRHAGLRRQFLQAPAKRSMGAGRDFMALRQDGSQFPVEVGLNPIVSEFGVATLAVVVDVSERKRTEEALRRSNAE